MKKLSFLAMSMLLAGCGDNANIQQVKDMVTLNDNTITVGNALDHRSVCEKVNWETGLDERNRDIVRYTCSISPNIANSLIERHIRQTEETLLKQVRDQAYTFSEQNKYAQLSRFYLQNSEKGLSALADSGLPLEYNQLKNTLLQYLRDNYQAKNIGNSSKTIYDFGLPTSFFSDIKEQHYITLWDQGGSPANQSDVMGLDQDAYITETIQKLISIEQQALTVLAQHNTCLDSKDSKGKPCLSYSPQFPCNVNNLTNRAFERLFFEQVAYSDVISGIQEQIIEYEQTREAMDARDMAYETLQTNIQLHFTQLKQQSQLTQLSQVVDFSIIKDQQPTVALCDFSLTTNAGDPLIFHHQFCFDMAYEPQWNDHFDGIVQSYYRKSVEPDLKTYLQSISKEERALWQVK
ncbi:hypothetical protein [Providencia rettgeri]|uniref:hypothetical protein n=1 Tax=Providencia rettgeri TaxID=587 RepID=UPI001BA8FF4C|nr:hypothetical protein [Providencia rettgeri]MBS0917582.1 hypothetical protein [Providencia rettgeri]